MTRTPPRPSSGPSPRRTATNIGQNRKRAPFARARRTANGNEIRRPTVSRASSRVRSAGALTSSTPPTTTVRPMWRPISSGAGSAASRIAASTAPAARRNCSRARRPFCPSSGNSSPRRVPTIGAAVPWARAVRIYPSNAISSSTCRRRESYALCRS